MKEAELKEAFEARVPALMALGEFVRDTITRELEEKLGSAEAVDKFLQIPPKPRVKKTDTFLEKALVRKPKEDPMSEITDQVGVRFVVLLLEEIDVVGEVIESGPWEAQKDRDYQIERLEKPEYFAYQSDHYVVRTRSEEEYHGVTIPARLPCEIQIRTILQHAYAEMAHGSAYKPPIRLPEEDQRHVNRSLAKGSALIEVSDDVFREIKDKLREYNESIDALLKRSSEVYEQITGEPAPAKTTLGEFIAETYRGKLKDLEPDDVASWAEDQDWLGDALKRKRTESVFYRDPIVILLGLIVDRNETSVPRDWPVDSAYLEDFYTMMGISTYDLF